jgi:hypothetical protein
MVPEQVAEVTSLSEKRVQSLHQKLNGGSQS